MSPAGLCGPSYNLGMKKKRKQPRKSFDPNVAAKRTVDALIARTEGVKKSKDNTRKKHSDN